MDKMLKQAAAAVHLWIAEARTEHRRALKHYRDNGKKRARMAHESMQKMHARLAYLVPLYRALRSASQQKQAVAGGEKGAQMYFKHFLNLREKMRLAALYPNSGRLDTLFGDGLLKFPILVPNLDIPPCAWQFRTLGDLFEEVSAELAAQQQAELKKARYAESARTQFLASLNDEQRAKLQEAFAAAKARGVHSITIYERDLA